MELCQELKETRQINMSAEIGVYANLDSNNISTNSLLDGKNTFHAIQISVL